MLQWVSEWRDFPALREILKAKPRTTRFDGLTSVSDTVFDRFSRHVANSAQVIENQDDVVAVVQAGANSADAVMQDLNELISSLEYFRSFLSQLRSDVHNVRCQAWTARNNDVRPVG